MGASLTRVMASIGGVDYLVHMDAPQDISIWLNFNEAQPNAFGLPQATSHPYAVGDFVASTQHGAGFNCHTLTLSPHGNGTHTECVGHIVSERVEVHRQVQSLMMPATVLSVHLVPFSQTTDTYNDDALPDDLVISQASLHEAFERCEADPTWCEALIIRTFPNDRGKCQANYTSQNPAYLTREAMQWVLKRSVSHLLLDLPSVDREEDSGQLLNHHAFWHIPQGTSAMLDEQCLGRTITEMIWVEDVIGDGQYMLSLQVPPWQEDAASSRPLLFPVTRY